MSADYLLMNSINLCSFASFRSPRESKKTNVGEGVLILFSIPVSFSEIMHDKLLLDFVVDIKFLKELTR